MSQDGGARWRVRVAAAQGLSVKRRAQQALTLCGLLLSAPLVLAQLTITDGGMASYSVPLAVPPGVSGMGPTLGIGYTASGVNGPVGYGWSLQGVSLITRCPQTRSVDGYARSIDFSGNDKLCLDGQRLIQTDASGAVVNGAISNPSSTNPLQSGDSLGGSGTAAAREYRTEKDTYARIRAYGSASADPANGPAYFKVWTKSGQIYEYGTNSNTTANATVLAQGKSAAVVWAVSRVSDTLGNYIDFQYEQRDVAWGSGSNAGNPSAGHEWNIVEIRYTGTNAQAPANKVSFSYADRDVTSKPWDGAEAYQYGSKTVGIRRLDSIRTYASGIKVKTVKLAYDNAPVTGRSRLTSITECAGVNETQCMPPTTFGYSAGGSSDTFQPNSNFANSSLATLPMTSTDRTYTVATGDFDGDGKTDILRLSNIPDNALLISQGDGTFVASGAFNLGGQRLYSSDGCYASVVVDVNGDGIADIVRTVQATSNTGAACAADSALIYIGNGDGSFKPAVALSGISLYQVRESVTRSPVSCNVVYGNPRRDGDLLAQADIQFALTNSTCYITRKSTGRTFFILDVNGDGKLDIVTTINPAYTLADAGDTAPSPDEACASIICTRVYLGDGAGNFSELTSTNLAHHSVYADPPLNGAAYSFFKINVVDVDADGLADLSVKTGTWRSTGDGNFTKLADASGVCLYPIDFNGDGRIDCLSAFSLGASYNALRASSGGAASVAAPLFNLTQPGQELTTPSNTSSALESIVVDLNGDGRGDILRWGDDPSKNTLYLSNGNGAFRESTAFNLKGAPYQLKKSDGSVDFAIGDFTGRGSPEILRMVNVPTAGAASSNQLYEKPDKTPADLLASVSSPTGLTTTLTWVPLSNSYPPALAPYLEDYGYRYKSDRGTANAAQYPKLDVTMPMYVVVRTLAASGVGGSSVKTEYSYAGLKGSYEGRGLLGFRETRRQSPGADGTPLTVLTQFVQTYPYTGTTSSSITYRGDLSVSSPSALSSSVYTYCDTTAAAGAESSASASAPCTSSAKVQRPYLYKTVETGTDLQGVALPGVTTVNAYDTSGNPTRIAITTTGNTVGVAQTFTKTTTNTYLAADTAGDNWILGRLQRATQRNVVPNLLSSLSTTAGSAPNASATQGNGATPTVSPAVLSVILQLLLDD